MAKIVDTEFTSKYRDIARSYLVQVLQEKEWTQAELARRTSVAASTFTRTLQDTYDSRITPQTLFKVAEISNIPLPRELLTLVDSGGKEYKATQCQHRTPILSDELFTSQKDIPLFSLLPSEQSDGIYNSLRRGVTDRPHILAGIMEARALLIPDETMKPVFDINHIVITNPSKIPRPGDDVVVEFITGDVTVRRLVDLDREKITLAEYHPRYRHRVYETESVHTIEPVAFVVRP